MNKKLGCAGLFVLLAAVLVVGLLVTRPVWGRQLQRGVLTVVSNDPVAAKLDDGQLHIITVGTGNPSPRSERVQTATAVMAGGNFILIDAGSGSAWRAQQLGLPMQALDAVLVTHFHSDHIADLGAVSAMSWRGGRDGALPVFGPAGTEAMMAGFRQAFAGDFALRTTAAETVDGFETLPLEVVHDSGHDIVVAPADACQPVFEGEGGFTVCAFLVDHHADVAEQSFGYKITYGGRTVIVSGDTRPNENLTRHAAGADILIHEAINPHTVEDMFAIAEASFADDPNVRFFTDTIREANQEHTTAEEAAQIAATAGVTHLVYNHLPTFGPRLLATLVGKPSFLQGIDDIFSGEVTIAEDGMELVLEPRS
jgi:ribonuclease Z